MQPTETPPIEERPVSLPAVVQSPQPLSPLILMQQLIERGADAEQLGKMMDLQERWQKAEALKAFNDAMARVQARIQTVKRDAVNEHTKKRYATAEALNRAIMPIYSDEGLALSFGEGDTPRADCVRLLCDVSHSAGYVKQYHLDVPRDGQGIKGAANMTPTQATGSTISYGRRYLTLLIFNVAMTDEDNDGQGDNALIGPGQVKALNLLLDTKNVDMGRFFRWLARVHGVEELQSFDLIRADKFDKVVSQIEQLPNREGAK